jgi:hypothetical protein
MKICLEKLCNMYFKKGAGIFDENSPLYIYIANFRNIKKKRAIEKNHLEGNLVKKQKI